MTAAGLSPATACEGFSLATTVVCLDGDRDFVVDEPDEDHADPVKDDARSLFFYSGKQIVASNGDFRDSDDENDDKIADLNRKLRSVNKNSDPRCTAAPRVSDKKRVT
ncbi:hypothetical protein Droror1_Dr00008841 [Drosera rotundifolia]